MMIIIGIGAFFSYDSSQIARATNNYNLIPKNQLSMLPGKIVEKWKSDEGVYAHFEGVIEQSSKGVSDAVKFVTKQYALDTKNMLIQLQDNMMNSEDRLISVTKNSIKILQGEIIKVKLKMKSLLLQQLLKESMKTY